MATISAESPCLVHALPGRARLHLPGWSGSGQRAIEARLRQVQGVRSAQGNPLTGNVLVRYDPAATDEAVILAASRTLASAPANEGLRVAVAGDAAMTRDFFWYRDYYFNTVDPEAAVTSIETIAHAADVVVPGHDNHFLNRRLE